MKSFLCKNKKPLVKWTLIPNNTFYKGQIPEGYSLGVCPGPGYVVVDVDRHGDKCGFDHLPEELLEELCDTLHYPTKNDGMHYWFKYTGEEKLLNKHGSIGVDLRAENRGYVVFYKDAKPQDCIKDIKESSIEMNNWLESLFSHKSKKK